jgi:hypothetical protein
MLATVSSLLLGFQILVLFFGEVGDTQNASGRITNLISGRNYLRTGSARNEATLRATANWRLPIFGKFRLRFRSNACF